MSGLKIGSISVGGFIVVCIIALILSITVIPQGHAGVVYKRSSGVQDTTLSQGWRLTSPMDRVTAYPISTETVKVNAFNMQTKDGKPLVIAM